MDKTFPITTKAEHEEIRVTGFLMSATETLSPGELVFRKNFTTRIEVHVDGKKFLVSPLALLAAVRVICGEKSHN